MSNITYANKEDLNVDSTIASKNKVMASDMNEIKTCVNDNQSQITTLNTKIDTKTGEINTNIGTLSNLTTSNKTNIVSAINEVDENSSLNTQHISQLTTKLNNSNSYSTTETEIGTWLGETLYRKVISCGALPNNATKNVAYNITNLKRIVKMYGYAYLPGSSVTYPLPAPRSWRYWWNIKCWNNCR